MPNHVINNIVVEKKYATILEEISKVGLLEYIKPMPKSLDTSDVTEDSLKKSVKWKETDIENQVRIKNQCDFNEKVHGHRTWYGWSLEHWGTKWADYETEFWQDDHFAYYRFTTAWSSPSSEIIRQFANIIPDFEYVWEEEQGFGERIKYENSVIKSFIEWDLPEWELVWEEDYGGKEVVGNESDYTYLKEPYFYDGETYPVGFYVSYNLNEYRGDTLTEAKATTKELEALIGFDKN